MLDGSGCRDQTLISELQEHAIHDVLATISKYRPSVDIAVA